MDLINAIIDVGALTTYRTQNDSVSSFPRIKFESIFAPGLYLVAGIKGLPVSVGCAWQAGPRLRQVNTAIEPTGYTRRFCFVAVDIPLFTFYTKPR